MGGPRLLYTASTLVPGKYWIEANDNKSVTQLDLWLRALPSGAITMLDFVAGQRYEFALFEAHQELPRWPLYEDGSGLGYPTAAPADAKTHKDVPTSGMPASVDLPSPLEALKAALSGAGPFLLVLGAAYLLLKRR